MGSISRDSTFNLAFASIRTKGGIGIGNPMDFAPDVEDEVIREAFSNKLDRYFVNSSNKV